MRNIKLNIEYDGSRYDGWQTIAGNTKSVTIQDKIEAVLTKMEEKKVELIGAARTEAGVHAYQQIANFHTDSTKKLIEIEQYLNRYLPRDIAVLKVEEVPERFHASFNAKSIQYEYRITMGNVPSVFDRKYNFYCFKQLNLEAMKKAADCFLGKHDFKAFSDNRRQKKSTERTIHEINIYGDAKEVTISVCGDDFWPHMIRIMVGTLMEVGLGSRLPDSMKELILGKDRELAGELAEAKGLFLTNISYE